MIELHFWTTPNGYKVLIFVEEAGIEYRVKPVNISIGEQFQAEFLEISPNNRIPAIVDHGPTDRGAALPVFESGAILWYLAEKSGQFLSTESRARKETLEWLMWQMAGLGPMLGQNHHFANYADEKIPYAIERYRKESARLYGVLERRLQDREYMVSDYSIADMAAYPWCRVCERQGIDMGALPNVQRWMRTIEMRPAVQRAYEIGLTINTTPTVTQASKAILFGKEAQ
jgi:GST-like protein